MRGQVNSLAFTQEAQAPGHTWSPRKEMFASIELLHVRQRGGEQCLQYGPWTAVSLGFQFYSLIWGDTN